MFHLARPLRHHGAEERWTPLNVEGTKKPSSSPTSWARGRFHHMSSIAVAGELRRPLQRGRLRRGQELATPTTAPSSSPRSSSASASRSLADLPPVARRRNSKTGEMDKIDGPYYFFKAIQKLRPRPAGVVPLVLLESAAPTSCPSTMWPRRSTTSPTRSASTARRSTSSTRSRRSPATWMNTFAAPPCAARGRARRQEAHRHAAEGRALRMRMKIPRCRGSSARSWPTSASPRGRSRTRSCAPASTPATPSGRWPARASSCPKLEPTPRSFGTTGSATSTPTCSRTARSRARSTAAPWSSPGRRADRPRGGAQDRGGGRHPAARRPHAEKLDEVKAEIERAGGTALRLLRATCRTTMRSRSS